MCLVDTSQAHIHNNMTEIYLILEWSGRVAVDTNYEC